ncbi:globoside alpha-1,3-N-acetylgalactosaminyltransferase 1-like [Salmo salar]|uniref:Globoside alpha-1,3-N-acetylgalactosaminyltransferase 1 isoform X3 n=1 Tax=Salmo salar TaxID=8030 RepID=A0ABM3EDP7_SALSA|nr:globoside alpha-1,3-N-acetylgalactosaminyltransferase 1 isoform X3 [Salmo salar]XP_045569252.1 globoside alpha-1,3-N-acetylgalactosaminyltransferase 1-like [Salmo salar]|eukprot:XP_014037736.1 PREDICTED: globoside alpha-1,3-N-acetylgalactosaminyltransferase 1-like isoform X2 [Salmo salar]
MRFSSNVKQFVLLIIVGIFLLLGYMVFNHFNERQNMVWFDTSKIHIPVDEDQRNTRLLYKQPSVLVGRTDVVAVTPWLAPIVWEGTFDPDLVDIIYKSMNLTIATTVFAVGKYVRFLQDFLETAEKHFMVDFNVRYYVFTDRPDDVPSVNLSQGRHLSVIQVPGSNRWQEISARRMEIIQTAIERQISREADYIFCLDVDSKFHARWGAESLGRLVAVIHPWFYQQTRDHFTSERRPASTAYIPMDEGDYYYAGAVFGGSVEDVYTLTKVCRNQLEEDARNSIEAAWQEESHLNRYLLYNKPSKLLSPEYQWDDKKTKTNEVKVIRFSSIVKNYAEIRPNE